MSPPSAWMAGRIASIVVRTLSSSTGWAPRSRGSSMVAQRVAPATTPLLQRPGVDLCSRGGPHVRCRPMLLAHNVGGGSLPAPAWLLGYIGRLRGPRHRRRPAHGLDRGPVWPPWARGASTRTPPGPTTSTAVAAATAAGRWSSATRSAPPSSLGVIVPSRWSGPTRRGANLATGPCARRLVGRRCRCVCLLAGRRRCAAINPFVPVVQWVEQMRPNLAEPASTSPRRGRRPRSSGRFSWFFLAYHRRRRPRAAVASSSSSTPRPRWPAGCAGAAAG